MCLKLKLRAHLNLKVENVGEVYYIIYCGFFSALHQHNKLRTLKAKGVSHTRSASPKLSVDK